MDPDKTKVSDVFYTEEDIKRTKATEQGTQVTTSLVLQLETAPAVAHKSLVLRDGSRLVRYRKELVKVGNYIKNSTGQAFSVTRGMLYHWAKTYRQWVDNGNKVPIPLGHDQAGKPEANQGWVLNMFVEGDSLMGILELLDHKLALTTDVSVCVPIEVIDGVGRRYLRPITHVALCTDPVVPGLGDFEELSLSQSQSKQKQKGDIDMDPKKLAEMLGMKGAEQATEDTIATAIKALQAKAEKVPLVQAVEASRTPATVDPVLVRVVAESRASKLNTLVSAGILTPACKDLIEAEYVKEEALTLSLSRGGQDGFDLLVKILAENRTTEGLLKETTKAQAMELSNTRTAKPNAMQADITRRRREAGLKD